MNVPNETSVSLKTFAEALEGIEITAYKIPKFHMPNWSKDVKVKGNLDSREYRIPVLSNTNLLEWETSKARISFYIGESGLIGFFFSRLWPLAPENKGWDSESRCYYNANSCSEVNLYRLRAAVLFDTFKEEMFKITFSKLKESIEIHSEVADKALKAFEPFVPFAVADSLSL